MHKNATKCNKTQIKWCINKHGASKIIDTFETYHSHSWRLRRPKLFASWLSCISAEWGSYDMEETRRRGGRMLCGEDA
jgi:hypothetical protein